MNINTYIKITIAHIFIQIGKLNVKFVQISSSREVVTWQFLLLLVVVSKVSPIWLHIKIKAKTETGETYTQNTSEMLKDLIQKSCFYIENAILNAMTITNQRNKGNLHTLNN